MKKIICSIAIAGLLAACGGNQKTPESKQEETKPLASINSAAFNQSFEKLINSYDSLKSALVEYDSLAINGASLNLAASANTLAVNEIQGDSTGAIKLTAESYASTISSTSASLIAAKNLEAKKRQFQTISDAMYELARTVRYDQQKLYHQRCPMAFNDDEEAFWLSKSDEIVNPYLGKKHPKYKAGMLHCGEVADSLDFSRK